MPQNFIGNHFGQDGRDTELSTPTPPGKSSTVSVSAWLHAQKEERSEEKRSRYVFDIACATKDNHPRSRVRVGVWWVGGEELGGVVCEECMCGEVLCLCEMGGWLAGVVELGGVLCSEEWFGVA